MRPPARRRWGRRDSSLPHGEERRPAGLSATCTLSALERSILRFHRLDDVPGFEIPSRYFHFLRTGDTTAIEKVLEHNRQDVISLAAVMSQALRLAAEGPEACETAGEQFGLGRLYERAGNRSMAMYAFRLAAGSGPSEVATQALARLALLLRRERRFDESAAVWRQLLQDSARLPVPLAALERQATEALAIHHEHRARDFGTARRYAQTLRARSQGRWAAEADHRLVRLDRRMRSVETGPGRPQRLFPG